MRLSACVILVSPGDSPHDPCLIWMAQRSSASAFLGGFYAFPGGAVEPEDGQGDDMLYRCAARELYEELGLLLCVQSDWIEHASSDISLDERLKLLNRQLDPERYHAAGRWTTPEDAPVRFETEFFLAHVSKATRQRINPSPAQLERAHLERPAWRSATEWLRLHDYGEVLLSVPTLEYVRELETRAYLERFVHDAHADPVRLYAHTGRTWRVPLKSPTLLPATHTNCYVIGDDEAFVIVDPGAATRSSLEPLCTLLDALFARGARCMAIILTHHHEDHTSGVPLLAARYDESWPIWAHAETGALIEAALDRALHHGDLLPIAAAHTLEVLFTPGHAPGHIALMHRESRALFCGDLVASQGTILVAPPRGHMGSYLASLKLARDAQPSGLHPAHGWPVADATQMLDRYVTHRLERESSVLDALSSRPNESLLAMDLVATVYRDVPPAIWPLAAMSLEAHLIHLSAHHAHVEQLSDFPGRYIWRAAHQES